MAKKDENGKYYKFDYTQFVYDDKGKITKKGYGGFTGFGPRWDGRQILDYDGTKAKYWPVKNLLQSLYDTGWNSNTSVAVSGANDKGHFYLSLSYNYRKGNLPLNEFSRNSNFLKSSYKLADWLRVDASMSYTVSIPKNPRNELGEKVHDGSFQPWYDVKKWRNSKYYRATHGGVPDEKYGDEYAYVPENAFWFGMYMNDRVRTEHVTRPIVKLTADITKWMSLAAEANMDIYSVNFEQKDLGTGYANEGGFYKLENSTRTSKTGKLSLNIRKNITQEITSGLLIGGEIWKNRSSWTKGETSGGLIVPGRFFLGNSKATKIGDGGVGDTKQINSLYFLANFGWREQLYLDVTGRNDWSSALIFSDGTGNYSYFYPSVSSSWIFSESLPLPSWFSFGKIRLSWAQVGNDTGVYWLNRGYGVGNWEIEGGFIYLNSKPTVSVDKSLKPELKTSVEAGFDMRFFNNRMGIDFAWYKEIIDNQIGEIGTSAESGISALLTNIGTMMNKGIEVSLKVTPVKIKNFEWLSTFNYWNNTTMISNLRPETGDYKVLGGSVGYGNFRIGSVAYENGEYGILMSDSKAKEWNNEEDSNDPRNGKKILRWSNSRRGTYYERSGKVEEIGKIQPDFEGSWDNTFKWKGINLSVLLDARFGGHVASYSSRYGTAYGFLGESLYGRSPEHGGITWKSKYEDTNGRTYTDGIIPDGVFKKGEKVTAPDGSEVDVGGMTFREALEAGYVEPVHASFYHLLRNNWGNGVINDSWFRKLNCIAVRNISIGYNLPKKIANKFKAQNAYLGINARNVGYLLNSLPNNINPEAFRGTSSTESFYERSFSPYTATYTFTLSLDF